MEPLTLAALAAATLVGSFVQSAIGFGFAFIAAPVFLWVMGSKAAIQVLVAIHIVQSLMLVPRLLPLAPRNLLIRLMAGAAVGIPLGLVVFDRIDVPALKLLVGITMVVASALIIARDRGWLAFTQQPGATPGAGVVAVGAIAGALTALMVLPGPALMIYLAARPLPKEISRAVSLSFFSVCYVAVTTMHATVGGMSSTEWLLSALLAPAVIAGTFLGNRLAGSLSEQRFRNALLALLLLSGLAAIWSAY